MALGGLFQMQTGKQLCYSLPRQKLLEGDFYAVLIPWPGSKGILFIHADEDKINRGLETGKKIIYPVREWDRQRGRGIVRI